MLSLLLLQHALAPSSIDARSRLPANTGGIPASDAGSRPYLKVAGALSLRFSAIPPPDLTGKPAAGAPPQPPSTVPAESAPSPAGHGSVIEPANKTIDSIPTQPVSPEPAPANATPPPAILPDDTRPPSRPEDFLPFFQFPSAARGVNVIVPAGVPRPPEPGQLPPSSATYQQK